VFSHVNVGFSTFLLPRKWELMYQELTLNGLIQKNHMLVDGKKFWVSVLNVFSCAKENVRRKVSSSIRIAVM
jgi:hypothetical protein